MAGGSKAVPTDVRIDGDVAANSAVVVINDRGSKFKATELWNQVVAHLKDTVRVKKRKHLWRSYGDCFTGADATDVVLGFLLSRSKKLLAGEITREKAKKLCQLVMDSEVFRPAVGCLLPAVTVHSWNGAGYESQTQLPYRRRTFEDSSTSYYSFCHRNNPGAVENSVASVVESVIPPDSPVKATSRAKRRHSMSCENDFSTCTDHRRVVRTDADNQHPDTLSGSRGQSHRRSFFSKNLETSTSVARPRASLALATKDSKQCRQDNGSNQCPDHASDTPTPSKVSRHRERSFYPEVRFVYTNAALEEFLDITELQAKPSSADGAPDSQRIVDASPSAVPQTAAELEHEHAVAGMCRLLELPMLERLLQSIRDASGNSAYEAASAEKQGGGSSGCAAGDDEVKPCYDNAAFFTARNGDRRNRSSPLPAKDSWTLAAMEVLDYIPKGHSIAACHNEALFDAEEYRLNLYDAITEHYTSAAVAACRPLLPTLHDELHVAVLQLLLEQQDERALAALRLSLTLLPCYRLREVCALLTFLSVVRSCIRSVDDLLSDPWHSLVLTNKRLSKQEIWRQYRGAFFQTDLLTDDEQETLLSFMVEKCQLLLAEPLIQQPNTSHLSRRLGDPAWPGSTFCNQITQQEYMSNKVATTNAALTDLMIYILRTSSMASREKDRYLRQLRQQHAELFVVSAV